MVTWERNELHVKGSMQTGNRQVIGRLQGSPLGGEEGFSDDLKTCLASKSRIQSLPLTPGSGVRGHLVSVRWDRASGDVRDVYSRSQTGLCFS